MNPVTMNELIDYSKRNQIGVGMFNIVNLEFAQAIFDAAQDTGIPVMLGMPERFILNYYDGATMAAACRHMIKNAKTPVNIHLDHGKSFDGVMYALKAGFSSVMFDGSSLDYEENVAQTAEIVKIAHAMGVSVEGELGYVGRVGQDVVDASGFTSPDQAEDFVGRTGVDALAIAIGNQHGQYKGTPKLDFDRLKAIRSRVGCGLVLHGGSGIADEDFVEAIRCGINKINIYTAEDLAAKAFVKEHFEEYPQYLDFTKGLRQAVYEVVKRHMLLFASAGK